MSKFVILIFAVSLVSFLVRTKVLPATLNGTTLAILSPNTYPFTYLAGEMYKRQPRFRYQDTFIRLRYSGGEVQEITLSDVFRRFQAPHRVKIVIIHSVVRAFSRREQHNLEFIQHLFCEENSKTLIDLGLAAPTATNKISGFQIEFKSNEASKYYNAECI